MRVVVTGATSMIGVAVVDRLLHRGDHVCLFQRRASGRSPADVDEVHGSIADPVACARACRDADAVVHLAARVGVVGTYDEFHQVNVVGTETVLAAAAAAGVERFVHVSSPSVAHAGSALVGRGADPADPTSTRGPYSTTKATAERLALAATDAFSVVAIRPHLVWGPGDRQLIGRVVDRARAGRLALVGSGHALIDTTYVDNAADALVAALDRAESVSGRAFVVSNGEPRPVVELFTRITAAAGIDWRPRRVPRPVAVAGGAAAELVWRTLDRHDDPPMTRFLAEQLSTAHWFEQESVRAALEWRPAVSLDDGFRRLDRSLSGLASDRR